MLDYFRYTRYLALALIAGFYLALCSVTRWLLWWLADSTGSLADWALVMAAGLVNDTVVALYVTLPVGLVLLVVPFRWINGPSYRRALTIGMFLMICALMATALAEVAFFEAFGARLNFLAVDFTDTPADAWALLRRQSWFGGAFVATFVLALLVVWRMAPQLRRSRACPLLLRHRLRMFAAHVTLAVVSGYAWSSDTLARFSATINNELAKNGLATYAQAVRTRDLNYAAEYHTDDKERLGNIAVQALGQAGGRLAQVEPQRLMRHFSATSTGLGHLNVVLIMEAGWIPQWIGAYGASSSATPNFDRLAQQGVMFGEAYAAGTGLYRALDAVLVSLPPLPGDALVARKRAAAIANWPRAMHRQGYQTSFYYGGGSARFRGLTRWFDSVGPVASTSIGDDVLFDQALQTYDTVAGGHGHFFSLIAAGFGRSGVSAGADARDAAADAGTNIRAADEALGKFFADAARRPWFRHTLFVVFADRGAGGSEPVVPVAGFRIPMLMLAPSNLPAGVETRRIGQMDLAPTVMGMLGLSYGAPFFGRDVFAASSDAILLTWHHDLALYQGERLCVLSPKQRVHVYRYDPAQDRLQNEAYDATLVDRVTAYYQTAAQLVRDGLYTLE